MSVVAAAVDLPARLRAETAGAHERMERLLPLMRDDLGIDEYRRVLRTFHDVHAALEPRIWSGAHRAALAALGLHEHERSKRAWLAADLAAVGAQPGDATATCAVPALADLSAALGALYVLEGATLGGRVVGPRLERSVGVTAAHGARFFASYGADVGRMWREFRDALVRHAASDAGDADAAVAAATATFDAIACAMRDAGVGERALPDDESRAA